MASQSRQSKVLRIGIIQDGKIVQERLVKAGESVTVGESAKNTFVFPRTHLKTPEFLLFQPAGNGYVLQFTAAMKGKISSGGAVVALQKVQRDPSVQKKGDVFSLPLSPQDRGKITIDSVTVLFQFVAPPPVKAVTPMQAMDFRPRLLEDDDPVFLGFLAIWSAFAVVLLIYVWNTEPREFDIDTIPDRFTKIVVPPKDPTDTPEPEIEEVIESADAVKKKEEEPKEPTDKPEPKDEKVEQAAKKEAKKEEVMQKSKLLLKLIATTGESKGGVVENLWDDHEQGLGNLDAALAEAGGVTTDMGDAGPRSGSGGRGDASTIGDIGAGGGGSTQVEAVDFKAAKVISQEGSMSELVGDGAAFKNTVTKNLPQLKYCYESRLKAVPSLQGRVEFGWSVSGGKVEGLYLVSNSTGDAELADCMQKRIRRWSFPADAEGDVSWPFVFQPK